MLLDLLILFYALILTYLSCQVIECYNKYSVKWNGYKYIIRERKTGKIVRQCTGFINGLFDMVILMEMNRERE